LKLRDCVLHGSLKREKRTAMATKGHTEEEILRVLREADPGSTVVEVCRKHGISQQSLYPWKK